VVELAATTIQRTRTPVLLCALVGLGGLFAGVTGPLLSTFIPPLVRDALGNHRTAIGGVMAIDNVLLLLLVPWAGAASDRASARGRGRLHIVLGGFVLAAAGMMGFPASPALGFGGVLCAMVVLYTGINVQRSPFNALMADLVPPRYLSVANASVMFQMCVGAIVFLMLGKILGMRPAFFIAAGTVLAIVAAFALALPRTAASASHAAEAPRLAAEATYRSLLDAAWLAIRGAVPGLRAIFIATLLQQMTFQTFTTWFALHGTERFGVPPEEVTTGFIAWAMGGVIGALPAGVIGVRLGRRNAMLLGFALMALCLLGLDRVTRLSHATVLLALAAACWTLPAVNAYPLFVEPVPPGSRGVLTSLFVLCMALGGGIGDPLNGALFDLAGGYRPMFLMMAGYSALAFVTVLFIPRGTGESATA
jgi:predicted MFS family arabinose efflux permease